MTFPEHKPMQRELANRAHEEEIPIVDQRLVGQVVGEIARHVGRANGKQVEFEYPFNIGNREKAAILQHLKKHQGSLYKRVFIVSVQVRGLEGGATLIQIHEKKKPKIRRLRY